MTYGLSAIGGTTGLLAQVASDDSLGGDATDAAFIFVLIVVTWVVGRLVGTAIRLTVRRLARRGLLRANSAWRTRVPRLVAESVPVAELRREQRMDAAAAMLSRLAKVGLWLTATVIALDRFDVDLLIAVSGAGFLGAAVAIGGQNSVHDYLNGLHVLLEDRLGAGDDVEVTLEGGAVVRGTVTRLGAFAVRLETPDGTYHLANRRTHQILNRSQSEYARLFDLRLGTDAGHRTDPAPVSDAVTAATLDVLGGVGVEVRVDHVSKAASGPLSKSTWRVAAHFSRAITEDELDRVCAVASERLR